MPSPNHHPPLGEGDSNKGESKKQHGKRKGQWHHALDETRYISTPAPRQIAHDVFIATIISSGYECKYGNATVVRLRHKVT